MVATGRLPPVQGAPGDALLARWMTTAANAIQERMLARELAWNGVLERVLQGDEARDVQALVRSRVDERLTLRGLRACESWLTSVRCDSAACIRRMERLLCAPDAQRRLTIAIELSVSHFGDLECDILLESSSSKRPHRQTVFQARASGNVGMTSVPRGARERFKATLRAIAVHPAFATRLDQACDAMDAHLRSPIRAPRGQQPSSGEPSATLPEQLLRWLLPHELDEAHPLEP